MEADNFHCEIEQTRYELSKEGHTFVTFFLQPYLNIPLFYLQ